MGAQIDSSRPGSPADAVRRWQRGDPRATDELARAASRLALRTAAALLGSREEAGEVAQDVAVDVLGSLSKLREPAAFNAWVHRITVRHALRHLKKRRGADAVETPIALLPGAEEPPAPEGIDRDTVLAARSALAAALAELPPKQRLALALRYVHDLSDAEIAAALGCRTGTVHALLSRGRSALRRDQQLAELALAFEGG
ncbi:MAG TPA: RNA polymerase sigma factor [Solirubrobacterales bacterium]|nr:RNA polymerase sigma factor [Solirubrobacterales bacterium]